MKVVTTLVSINFFNHLEVNSIFLPRRDKPSWFCKYNESDFLFGKDVFSEARFCTKPPMQFLSIS